MIEAELEAIIEKARVDGDLKLDLSRIKISTLPESIGNLTNLIELKINDTLLKSLPESIGNLVNLNRLSLD